MRLLVSLFALVCVSGCAFLPPVNRDASIPLGPVAEVDLDRYAGRWYELARLPNRFERGCEGVTAEYARRADGRISVVNTCREGAPDGPVRVARGVARVAEPASNAKLKVRFGFPIEGDYWVLARADDYAWAIVGEPSGRFLWLLSRTPTVPEALRADLIAQVEARGYDTRALYWPAQPPA